MTAEIVPLHRGWTPNWTFGEKLRKIRRETHLNQEDFARAIGVGSRALAAWESGRNKPRHLDEVAYAIEGATGASAAWILEGSGFSPEPRDPQVGEEGLEPPTFRV